MQDSLDDRYLEEDNFDCIDGLSLSSSQPENSLLESSQDGDLIDDYNKDDNMSLND